MAAEERAAGPLVGRVALVTGAARGMGAAIGARLAADGAAVVLGDVRADDVRAGAARLGSDALGVDLDVSSASDWERTLATVEERFGRLDVLVNNAGILRTGSIEEMDPDEFVASFGVNQLGPWLGIRTAAPLLRRSGGGAIVNISSIAALAGLPGASAYCASKAAVSAITKVAAIELADSGIRVNAVLPGATDTDMSARARAARTAATNPFGGQPIARAGTVDEIASLVAFIVADATYCTGADFVVDGGVTAGLPSGAPISP